MQPGDEVICSYEEYTKYKELDAKNKQLKDKNIQLQRQIKELNSKLQSYEYKIINKNGLLAKEQLKVQFLIHLLDDIRCGLDIKAETIGHGFKEMKGMDETTKFSVLRAPSDKGDIQERLPDNFSKPNTYMEICNEFQSYRALSEVCASEWKDKLKAIDYLEKEIDSHLKKGRSGVDDKDESRPQVIGEVKEAQNPQRVAGLEIEVMELKKKMELYESKYKRAVQKHTQEVATLRTQLIHMQEQLLSKTKALQQQQLSPNHQKTSNNDTKSKLMQAITNYTISISENMMMLSMTAQDKKAILQREIKDIEDLFKQSVKQLYV